MYTASKCVSNTPNATANVIDARKKPRYFGSEISLKYVAAGGLNNPTQNPDKNLPNSSHETVVLIDIMHQLNTNGTFNIKCVAFLPRRSIKIPPNKQPNAIGSDAIEAKTEIKIFFYDILRGKKYCIKFTYPRCLIWSYFQLTFMMLNFR